MDLDEIMILGNRNLKSELLTLFTSQNESENRNRNHMAHPNLGIKNKRLIINESLGINLLFLKLLILFPINFYNALNQILLVFLF